ncbi:beta-galactosidase A [Pestalotiopsis fici W106-1]|uniref:beta-galactosidase n=1 Tax=Pestalotiopsis fici (strain W106-1 / CGMCC3.15140) TaxID=1229662 RepID=W3WZA6_PESFW|nr:beta-galactosidase A [Pestalotiopsis fici W106-1]ETS78462.1 beta-galactosidase A [Pestalotiopsis fici W106-1]
MKGGAAHIRDQSESLPLLQHRKSLPPSKEGKNGGQCLGLSLIISKRLAIWLCTLTLLATFALLSRQDHDGAYYTVPQAEQPKEQPQNIVTWDERSLFIRGQRVMVMSGELHPWRLVPSLYDDVFQKIKALGFNCVSFYVMWALVEPAPGNFTATGVFAYEPFLEAASRAGIYLIARPGPYINAEVSFGGYPGWMQRVNGQLRTRNPEYLAATDNYIAQIGAIIAKAQITNDGPVILYQPENEYTWGVPPRFPDGEYMQYVEDQARKAGIVVPIISNDAAPLGHNAPGTGAGEVDIYGHDDYPLKFDCSNPTSWPKGALNGLYHSIHEVQSPSTPFSILEFQGGAFDPWGGPGFENCALLLNEEFERVFYKNNLAAGVTIFNIYMVYGGTNWGNIGHPGGYTSYDYGSPIKEDFTVGRKKYSELKLLAQWLQMSPGYLTAKPGLAEVLTYCNDAAITVTRLKGDSTIGGGSFFIIRHSDYTSTVSTNYKLELPTSRGKVSIPALYGSLTLNGRDSKIAVTDYDVHGSTLIYSTAEILTHQKYTDRVVLVVYTGPGETNELAIKTTHKPKILVGDAVAVHHAGDLAIMTWDTSGERKVIRVGNLFIFATDRDSAYRYWVPSIGKTSAIILGPYLVRNASLHDYRTLSIQADFTENTTVEILGLSHLKSVIVNGVDTPFRDNNITISLDIHYKSPQLKIPVLASLKWRAADSLPELHSSYDDSQWPSADLSSNNTYQHQWTPTSLFASDYGFHAGVLVFRGHFVAQGTEESFDIQTQGGTAYGHTVWLNNTFLGSEIGKAGVSNARATYRIPDLLPGKPYVLTVIVDNMGLDENGVAGVDSGKAPRGILRYNLKSSWFRSTPIDWKLTGNLHGEDSVDRSRGPLNEGGLFAERQGWHLPKPPIGAFRKRSPLEPISEPGVWIFTSSFDLDLPSDYEIPLSFVLGGVTGGAARIQLYVNGWQYGKYISHIGPQTRFPVPEGILNYHGENWIALLIWTMEDQTTQLEDFRLERGLPVYSGRSAVKLVDSPSWKRRDGAY